MEKIDKLNLMETVRKMAADPLAIFNQDTQVVDSFIFFMSKISDQNKFGKSFILITSNADFEEFLVGEEYVLPGKLVIILGIINISDKAIRLSTNTVLRGFAGSMIISSADGVVRATNLDSAVIIREINFYATAGRVFNLQGTVAHQLNVFFVGMFGASVGTINGFDVQAIKDCFISCANGFYLTGTTNKVFISSSPFYSITGAAITLGSGLVANVADLVTNFYKFDSPGVGILAEAGYTVGKGKLRGTLIDGTAIPLQGLHPRDINWSMTDNTGIRDSRYAGGIYLTAQAATTFTAPLTPVKVQGTTLGLSENERWEAGNNRMTYRGEPPRLANITGSLFVEAANNVELNFYVAKSTRDANGAINGIAIIPESKTILFVGSGQDRRQVSVAALTEVNIDDYIEIWVETTSGTASMTVGNYKMNIT